MIANRSLVFIKALSIILKLTWIERERDYKNTLLLNALYFLNPEDISNESVVKSWKEQLSKMMDKSTFKSERYDDNYRYFFDRLLPQYFNWYITFKNLESKKALIVNLDKSICGKYIFNSKIGFNVLISCSTSEGKNYLTVKRAGYEWYEERDGCFMEDVEFGSKVVLYK